MSRERLLVAAAVQEQVAEALVLARRAAVNVAQIQFGVSPLAEQLENAITALAKADKLGAALIKRIP